MYDEKRTPTLSHHAKTRIYLVHLGFQHPRNCTRQYRYFCRMACDLAPPVQHFIQVLPMSVTGRYHWHRNYGENDKGDSYIQKGPQRPDIIMQPMGFASTPISIPGKKEGSIFRGKKKYHRPFLSYTYPDRPTTSPFMRLQTPKRKKTQNLKKRSRKVNHQKTESSIKWDNKKNPFHLSKAAMPTFMLVSVPITRTATTTTVNLLVPSKLPSTLNVPTVPKPQASQSNIQIMAQTLQSSTTFIPGALRLVLRWGLVWNKAEGEREEKQDHKKRTEGN